MESFSIQNSILLCGIVLGPLAAIFSPHPRSIVLLLPVFLWLATQAFPWHQQVQLLGEGLYPLLWVAWMPIIAWPFEAARAQLGR